jgi:hypothetical protein
LETSNAKAKLCGEELREMFATMLLAISIVALSQFAVYYWRAVLSGVAAQPVSERVLAAANLEVASIKGHDFEKLAGLHELTPALRTNSTGLTLVRAYYRVLEGLASLSTVHMPAMASWCERERVICARYAAVQIDRRLQMNLEMAAALRSC